MEDALQDEVISINAIYGAGSLYCTSESENLYSLKVPDTDITLRLLFPADYPRNTPRILGPEAAGAETRKGKAQEVADVAHALLRDNSYEEEPCIFSFLEDLRTCLTTRGVTKSEFGDGDDAVGIDQSTGQSTGEPLRENPVIPQEIPEPPWTLSEVITEKKSTFIARIAAVASVAEAKTFIQHLVTTDKKAAKATHNITAWRIRDSHSPDITFQDCDDDGENAAGGRLLHLLQLIDAWNCVVVVTRWFGGIHLGPDRFRIINAVARDAAVRAGFAEAERNAVAHDKRSKR